MVAKFLLLFCALRLPAAILPFALGWGYTRSSHLF